MKSVKVIISHADGLHARPASVFVENANKFKSEIYLTHEDVKINAKSIMSILTLELFGGTEVILEAEGPDENEAVEALQKIL